uniref:SPRY domain-containing protein n=1 Tax=Peronospora matthiolae TaxID=2874970 RepID=A0AAV1T751_9STRA
MDSRSVATEGLLHADRCTAKYVGRAVHRADAACFRSSRAAAASAPFTLPRIFYYETRIMATSPTPELAANSLPARLNTQASPTIDRTVVAQHQDADMPSAQSWRRSPSLQSRNTEDMLSSTSTDLMPVERPMRFSVSSTAQWAEQLQSIINRRQVRLSKDKKKFKHEIAVGFIVLDKEERKSAAWDQHYSSSTSYSRSDSVLDARVPRVEVKQTMRGTISDMVVGGESKKGIAKYKTKTRPAIFHEDLQQMVNSVAYVGKTGHVVSHQQKYLQCQRYGAGDVVGCGILFDTNTFFFTRNGSLVGLLAAADVRNLDNFGEDSDLEEEKSGADDSESYGEDKKDGVVADEGTRTTLDSIDVADTEETGDHCEVKNVLYPCVSLHGVGECVRAVFKADAFLFDLPKFERQIQKNRQEALIADRERRRKSGNGSETDHSERKTESRVNELVQDFLLYHGYESAYETFKAALEPSKRQCLSSGGMEVVSKNEAEASVVSSAGDMDGDHEREVVKFSHAQSSLHFVKKKQMRESLSLRHEVREHIRCCRTAQALALLEQHEPALATIQTGRYFCRMRKIIQSCRILCVVDILTHGGEAKIVASSSLALNGASELMTIEKGRCNGWNSEMAIEFARQVFGSSSEITTKGKRKRPGLNSGAQKQSGDTTDVALAMSLLLYGQRDTIPKSSRARRFLTPEFRESVAEQLNELLLMYNNGAEIAPPASALVTFMEDHEKVRMKCLERGCRVYPESDSNGVSKIMSGRRKVSVSSNVDKFSSSSSEQDDHSADEDDDDDEE